VLSWSGALGIGREDAACQALADVEAGAITRPNPIPRTGTDALRQLLVGLLLIATGGLLLLIGRRRRAMRS
jgi:uncharacterized surface anchored protein